MNTPTSASITISSTDPQSVEIGLTYSGFVIANTSSNKVSFSINGEETVLDTINSYKRVEPPVDKFEVTGEVIGQKVIIFKY